MYKLMNVFVTKLYIYILPQFYISRKRSSLTPGGTPTTGLEEHNRVESSCFVSLRHPSPFYRRTHNLVQ